MGQCIEQPELDDFVGGKLSEQRAEEVSQHIDHCDACQDTVVALSAHDDTFVEGLRTPDSIPEGQTADPAFRHGLQRLLNQVKQTGFAASDVNLRNIGPYVLQRKLGDGGMGTVYLAEHSKLKRTVAIKILPAHRWSNVQAIARFEREMEAIGGLDHPNIVRAMDAGEDQGLHFLVMEFVDGMDLSQLVRRLGSIPVADACEIGRQIAVGLQHAHDRGLVHRDVKPSNLMLSLSASSKGSDSADAAVSVKLLDLGLALLGDEHLREDHDVTTVGALMGTLDYMSPEQGVDSHSVDHRADIYGLGATLFKLLTGRAPYADPRYSTLMKKMTALATKAAPSLGAVRPELPSDVIQIVDRMLTRDPDQRQASAREVAEALEKFSDQADLPSLLKMAAAAPEPKPLATDSSQVQPLVEDVPAARPTVKNDSAGGIGEWIRSNAFIFGGMACLLLGIFTYRYVTDYGEVSITSTDPELQVLLKRKDQVVKQIRLQELLAKDEQDKDNRRVRIRAGRYEIEVLGKNADIAIVPSEVVVRRNDVSEIPIAHGEPKRTLAKEAVTQVSLPVHSDDVPAEPRYEGRTLRQWLGEVRYERSRGQLIMAIEAMTALAVHPENLGDLDTSIEAILMLMRQFGEHPAELGQPKLSERGWYALLQMPREKVVDHLIREIDYGNQRSREFLFFVWSPVWSDFSPPVGWYNAAEKLKEEIVKRTRVTVEVLARNRQCEDGFAARFLNALMNSNAYLKYRVENEPLPFDQELAATIFRRELLSNVKYLRALSTFHLASLAPETPGLADTAKAILRSPFVQPDEQLVTHKTQFNDQMQQSVACCYLALKSVERLGPTAEAFDDVVGFLEKYGQLMAMWNSLSLHNYSPIGWTVQPIPGIGDMGGYGGGYGYGGGFGGGVDPFSPSQISTSTCNFHPAIVQIVFSYEGRISEVIYSLLYAHNVHISDENTLRLVRSKLLNFDPSLSEPVLMMIETSEKDGNAKYIWKNSFNEAVPGNRVADATIGSENEQRAMHKATLAAILRQRQSDIGEVMRIEISETNGAFLVSAPPNPQLSEGPVLNVIWPEEAWFNIRACRDQLVKEVKAAWPKTRKGESLTIDLTAFAKEKHDADLGGFQSAINRGGMGGTGGGMF